MQPSSSRRESTPERKVYPTIPFGYSPFARNKMSVADHANHDDKTSVRGRLGLELEDHYYRVNIEQFMHVLRDDGRRAGLELQDLGPNAKLCDEDADMLTEFSDTDFEAIESVQYPVFVSDDNL